MMIGNQLGFLLVSLTLGELGDGLNLFQGIYLIEIGWKESQVGIALALRGLAALLAQPMAGVWVESSRVDRRLLLALASLGSAAGASTILWIRENEEEYQIDKVVFFASKFIEGISASFIIPCVALITLAQFGPERMDAMMASHMVWSQIGAVLAAIAAGIVAYIYYPNVKYCFLVITIAALSTILFLPFLSRDSRTDPKDGIVPVEISSKKDATMRAPQNHLEHWKDDTMTTPYSNIAESKQHRILLHALSCPRTRLLCIIGFFFQ
jgi:MFS family permease